MILGAVWYPAYKELDNTGDEWRYTYQVIPPWAAWRMVTRDDQSKAVFVDIREKDEFDLFHLPTAIHIPLRDIDTCDLSFLQDADLVVPYCWKDLRGFEAARKLQARGIETVALFEGFGFKGWEDAGLPFVGTATGAYKTDYDAIENNE